MTILKLLHKHLLISFFLLAYVNSYSQNFALVEVSAKKKEMYQSMLESNRILVSFIENSLVQNGLPKMMRNLALIESNFNKDVVSSAKAVGVWQFMEAHAAQYGLESEKRSDIYHSTQTAMKSLKNLYAKYRNWITVVAAYNCGEGNINKAMVKANSDRYDDFYTYLPSETIEHVRKFMEACVVTNEFDYLMTDYKVSKFKLSNNIEDQSEKQKKDPALTSTEINTAYNLNVIAKEMNVKRADLDKWNPSIETELIKNGIAMLYLPIDKMPDFLLLKNTILNLSLQITTDYDKQKL